MPELQCAEKLLRTLRIIPVYQHIFSETHAEGKAFLGHIADAEIRFLRPAAVMPEHAGRKLCKRGFAAAVCTDDRVYLSFFKAQFVKLKDAPAVVAFFEVSQHHVSALPCIRDTAAFMTREPASRMIPSARAVVKLPMLVKFMMAVVMTFVL